MKKFIWVIFLWYRKVYNHKKSHRSYREAIFLIIAGLILLPSFRNYALDKADEELKLYLGGPQTIPVSNPVRIAIANPEIVDVVRVTPSEITLNPKKAGTTNFVFWDNFGEQSLRLRVLTEDLTDIKNRIDILLKELNLPAVYTRLVDTEDKILLMGEVKNAQDRERIFLTISNLKDKVVDLIKIKEEEAVVDIDVQILELNKGATETLGLTWPSSINFLEVGSPALASSGVKFGRFFRVHRLERATYASGTATTDPFTLKLDALIQEGKARILSRPRLACQSGKEAELLVGGEKPIFTTVYVPSTGSVAGQTTGVEYKDYGIKLKIKPTVTEDKRVKLGLNVEVSELESTTPETIGSSSAPTAKAYPLTRRNTTTELLLDDGQTLAIGGLIKQKSSEELRKVPWLADIPVLGMLFKKKTTTKGGGYDTKTDTELFITLTPTIISQQREKQKTEEKIKEEIAPQAKEVLSALSEKSRVDEQEEVAVAEEKIASEVVAAPAQPQPLSKSEYARIIQKRILENLTYPASAKEAGLQGTVELSLHFSYRGELLEAVVKSSSGAKILDDHAVAVAKEISVYPPFPSSIESKDLWIEIPIAYQLN